MKLTYHGPEGQANFEVGVAMDGSALLEPDKVYDLPPELGRRLVASSEHWSRVTDLSKLRVEQLRDLAREEEIDGFSTMKGEELLAALRGESVAPAPAGVEEPPVVEEPQGGEPQ